MTAPSPEGRDLWRYRRRLISATCFVCLCALFYLLGWGRETTIHQLLAEGFMWLLGCTVTGYTLGAVADDFQQRSRWTGNALNSPGLALDRRGAAGPYAGDGYVAGHPHNPVPGYADRGTQG